MRFPGHEFLGKGRLDVAVNSLLGLLEGVAADGVITDGEIALLEAWLEGYREHADCHPFSELIPVLAHALADRIITADEREDITWLCRKMQSTQFYDAVTAGLQRLHGVIGGIAADGLIEPAELGALRAWLDQHEHLVSLWPYDEVSSLVTDAMADRRITAEEHQRLLEFFRNFTPVLDDRTITQPLVRVDSTLTGVCAVCPEITFLGARFCFTGESVRHPRARLAEMVEGLGGRVVASVSARLDYLVICAGANPNWAYACYGRKVEQAVGLRKEGARIVIVHENDFHDAVGDARANV